MAIHATGHEHVFQSHSAMQLQEQPSRTDAVTDSVAESQLHIGVRTPAAHLS